MTTYPPGPAPAGGIVPAAAGGAVARSAAPVGLSGALTGLSRSVDPELARVSVLSGRTQVDLALPADVPVASLLPELAGLLLRNQFGEPERVADDLSVRWTLAKVGHEALEDSRTLIESGIVDGDLLVLRSESTTELPTIYDDVIDAVAGIARREFNSWTPAAARWLGVVTFVLTIAATAGLVMAASWDATHYDLAALGFVAFVVFFVADVIARSAGAHRSVGAALTVGSCLAVFVGCFAILPGTDRAANILLGAGVSALVAVVAMRVTVGEPFTHLAAITLSVLVALGALIQVTTDLSVRDTSAILTVVALMLALMAPRLTILLVRLPIPAVPAAGASLDDIDPPSQSNINAGVAAIGAVALPETTALEVRAKAANSYMSGMMLAAAVVAGVTAILGAIPDPDFYWQSFVLGLLIGLASVLRGRSHTDLVQASGMIASGFATIVVVLGVQILAGDTWVIIAVGSLLLMSAAAFGFGVITPSMEFSPVLRRVGEVLEYLIITVTVPLAAWVIGLYSLARGL